MVNPASNSFVTASFEEEKDYTNILSTPKIVTEFLSTSQIAVGRCNGAVYIYATSGSHGQSPEQPLKVMHHYHPGEPEKQPTNRSDEGSHKITAIQKISGDRLVTASDYRIKLWDLTRDEPTGCKIAEFDSPVVKLEITNT